MTEPTESDRAWHCAMRCLEYFDSYKIATIAPLAAEIEKEIAAAREEGRREAIERKAVNEIEILARVFREAATAFTPRLQQQLSQFAPGISGGVSFGFVDPADNAREQTIYGVMNALAYAMERAAKEIAETERGTESSRAKTEGEKP